MNLEQLQRISLAHNKVYNLKKELADIQAEGDYQEVEAFLRRASTSLEDIQYILEHMNG